MEHSVAKTSLVASEAVFFCNYCGDFCVVSEAFFVTDYLAISVLIFQAMSIKISVAIMVMFDKIFVEKFLRMILEIFLELVLNVSLGIFLGIFQSIFVNKHNCSGQS